MKKYCVLLPINFVEYIMLLNLLVYFNSRNRNNLIVYSEKQISDMNNIFTTNNFRTYDEIKPYITSKVNLNEYKKINIENLFLNTIIFNNVTYTLNNIYSKMFVNKFMIIKQFIKKKTKNRAIVLIEINEESIKNIIYYIISIQALLKIEYIKENKTFDNSSKINLDSGDFSFLIYSQDKKTEEENIIYSKQFIHQLCIALPRLKEYIINVNVILNDLVKTNTKDLINFILFNISYYNIIYKQEDLLLVLSNYNNTNCNIIYPDKILKNNLIQILKIKLGTINYKTITQYEDIENKRLINI